jgi:hypothetical protein
MQQFFQSMTVLGFLFLALALFLRMITKGTEAEKMNLTSYIISVPMLIGAMLVFVSAPLTSFSL